MTKPYFKYKKIILLIKFLQPKTSCIYPCNIQLLLTVNDNSMIHHHYIKPTNNLKLTKEQQVAFESINKAIKSNEYKEVLLYGVTGSRKNRSIFAVNRTCIK